MVWPGPRPSLKLAAYLRWADEVPASVGGLVLVVLLRPPSPTELTGWTGTSLGPGGLCFCLVRHYGGIHSMHVYDW